MPANCCFRATPMDVAEWLRGLGLEHYAPAFRDNDIDGEVLRRLTADDLRDLGVASIGHPMQSRSRDCCGSPSIFDPPSEPAIDAT
jgi:SAM domain (Sterile alpha motif)